MIPTLIAVAIVTVLDLIALYALCKSAADADAAMALREALRWQEDGGQ